MAYLLGTDEAGYGPNLGPLVISATVWRVPDEAQRADLYDVLSETVSARPVRGDRGPVAIADSKVLYKGGGRLASLERGVFAALALTGRRPESWRGVWDALDPDSAADRTELPWHDGYNAPVPIDVAAAALERPTKRLEDALARSGVELVSIRSTAVFPGRFNRLVRQLGNKSTALSQATLALVASQMAPLDNEPILVVCDKHGGRNRYGPLLQQAFPDELVQVYREGRRESLYRWGPPQRRIEVGFRAGGERFLPSALASMASKYLRELAMRALNRFWRRRVPDLRPTAGYPVDAKRFKREIAPVQNALGIEDDLLWRIR